MINFVIYYGDEKMRKAIENEIKKFLFSKPDYYKIHSLGTKKKADEELLLKHMEGTKIYIIDIDSDYKSPAFAKKIRENGDFMSPIILLTKNDRATIIDKLNHVLFLDLIKVDKNFYEVFHECLYNAYKIVTRYSVYSFSIFDEIYRIPYDDIYYIVKNFCDNSVTIYTKDDSFVNYASVRGLDELLCRDARFFRTHRSCIINLSNVSSYDRRNNILVFKNGMTIDMISKKNKPVLIERLKNFGNVE